MLFHFFTHFAVSQAEFSTGCCRVLSDKLQFCIFLVLPHFLFLFTIHTQVSVQTLCPQELRLKLFFSLHNRAVDESCACSGNSIFTFFHNGMDGVLQLLVVK